MLTVAPTPADPVQRYYEWCDVYRTVPHPPVMLALRYPGAYLQLEKTFGQADLIPLVEVRARYCRVSPRSHTTFVADCPQELCSIVRPVSLGGVTRLTLVCSGAEGQRHRERNRLSSLQHRLPWLLRPERTVDV